MKFLNSRKELPVIIKGIEQTATLRKVADIAEGLQEHNFNVKFVMNVVYRAKSHNYNLGSN